MTGRPPDGATVHVVVPDGIDDVSRPSGGNVYDRRVCDGLRDGGWTLREHPVAGRWPRPTRADLAALAGLLAGLPDDATVLVDGLVGSAAEALPAEAGRLRLVVLLHMPLAEADESSGRVERAALSSGEAVVTTSRWARQWVITHHGLDPDRVHVAVPGVDPAPPVAGSAGGGSLLCVGPVTRDKGHDTLLDALVAVRDLDWRCTCVGALDLDPNLVARLTETAARAGVSDRVSFPGPLSRADLEEVRSRTDLVVSASRRESYGMALAEGLARGIPVVATSVGGHPEVVARAGDGSRPGMLVPVDDADRLAGALRRWLTDADARTRLRRSAALRGPCLPTWARTVRTISDVLSRAAAANRKPPGAVYPASSHGSER